MRNNIFGGLGKLTAGLALVGLLSGCVIDKTKKGVENVMDLKSESRITINFDKRISQLHDFKVGDDVLVVYKKDGRDIVVLEKFGVKQFEFSAFQCIKEVINKETGIASRIPLIIFVAPDIPGIEEDFNHKDIIPDIKIN